MKSSFLIAAALVAAPHFAQAADDCGCAGAPAPAATATSVPATPLVLEPTAEPDAKLTLRLKLPVGQKYTQKMTMDQRTTTVVGRQKISMSFGFTMGIAMDVLSVSPEGNMTVRYTFGEMKVTMGDLPTNPSLSKKANSDAAAGLKKSMDKMFAAFRGRTMQAVLSPEGRALSITGVKELFDAIIKAAPAAAPAEQAEAKAMMRGLVKSFTDKDNGFLKIAGEFPENAIAVGESWTSSQSVTQPIFTLKTDARYTLAARENGVAKVDVALKMSTPLPKAGAKPKPGAMKMNLAGAGKGTMNFDEATGMVTHSEVTTTSTNKVNVPGGGKNGAPMTVTAYASAHVTMDATPVP